MSSDARPPRVLGAPRVLAEAPGVTAFAQDRGRIAWWSDDSCPALHIRTIATGAEVRIPPSGQCGTPDYDVADFQVSSLALAGGRALWSVDHNANFDYEQAMTASLADRKIRLVGEELGPDDWNEGAVAGDSRAGPGGGVTLAYTQYAILPPDVDEPADAPRTVSATNIHRVVGAKPIEVPDAWGFAIAASGGRMALLAPSGFDGATHSPYSDDRFPVEVRDVVTGAILGKFEHRGRATAIALGPDLVAILVHEDGSTRIETYSIEGRPESEANVPADVTDLSLAGETVVFHSGTRIEVLNARSGRAAAVAVARGEPIGLSIEGNRIAWAERGRIVAVYLSAPVANTRRGGRTDTGGASAAHSESR